MVFNPSYPHNYMKDVLLAQIAALATCTVKTAQQRHLLNSIGYKVVDGTHIDRQHTYLARDPLYIRVYAGICFLASRPAQPNRSIASILCALRAVCRHVYGRTHVRHCLHDWHNNSYIAHASQPK